MLELDPSKTFSLTLKPDTEADESKSPTYIFRCLTARECGAVEACFSKSRTADDWIDVIANIIDGLKICLVGWRNVGNDARFNAADIDAYAGREELIILRDNLLPEMTISALEKKVQALRSRVTTAKSAVQNVSQAGSIAPQI